MYSCSMPNHGFSMGALLKISAAATRVLVGSGVPPGVYVSVSTRMLSPPRNGSL